MPYTKGSITYKHTIESSYTLTCAISGRIIATFYNEADLDDVLEKLTGIDIKVEEDAFRKLNGIYCEQEC